MIIISFFNLHIISLSTEYLQSFLHKEFHIALIVSVKLNLKNVTTAQYLCVWNNYNNANRPTEP